MLHIFLDIFRCSYVLGGTFSVVCQAEIIFIELCILIIYYVLEVMHHEEENQLLGVQEMR